MIETVMNGAFWIWVVFASILAVASVIQLVVGVGNQVNAARNARMKRIRARHSFMSWAEQQEHFEAGGCLACAEDGTAICECAECVQARETAAKSFVR